MSFVLVDEAGQATEPETIVGSIRAAQGALRTLVNVGGPGEVLPLLNVPLPKGCSPDGRGCGPLDAPGLDLARPDMEARKAS